MKIQVFPPRAPEIFLKKASGCHRRRHSITLSKERNLTAETTNSPPPPWIITQAIPFLHCFPLVKWVCISIIRLHPREIVLLKLWLKLAKFVFILYCSVFRMALKHFQFPYPQLFREDVVWIKAMRQKWLVEKKKESWILLAEV